MRIKRDLLCLKKWLISCPTVRFLWLSNKQTVAVISVQWINLVCKSMMVYNEVISSLQIEISVVRILIGPRGSLLTSPHRISTTGDLDGQSVFLIAKTALYMQWVARRIPCYITTPWYMGVLSCAVSCDGQDVNWKRVDVTWEPLYLFFDLKNW